jgi:hypothetical protein
VAQGGEDPALGHEDVGLDDGLVSRPPRAGGHDGRPIVLGELCVGPVDDGFVAARLGDATPEVVRDE